MNGITKRQQSILKLFVNSNEHLTGLKISQILHVSSKTVRNEIKVLNDTMKDFAVIISIPSRGYQLKILENGEFEKWICAFNNEWSQFVPANPLERVYYILGLMLEKQDFIKIDDISDMLYIDRTSVSRSLKNIRECLDNFGLEMIQKTGKGLMIEGNEFRYRLCMAEYIYHKPEMLVTEIGRNDDFIHDLKQIIFNDGITMPQRVFSNFVIHMQVQLNRIQRGKYISFEDEEIKNIINEYEFLVAKDVSMAIKKHFQIDLSVNEQCYLAIHILGKKSNSTSAIESCVNDQLKEEIAVIIDYIFKHLFNIFKIDFRGDVYLKKALGLHIYPMENRLKFNTYLRNPLLNHIKEKYTFAYILAMESWKVIANYTDYIKIEDEIGYIAIHFQYALERRKRRISKKKVLLVNEYSVALSELLNFSILKKYKDSLIIEKTIAAGELSNYKLENYDYIITTVPIYQELPIPVIRIDPIITNKDFETLKKYFNRSHFIDLKNYIEYNHIYLKDATSKIEFIDIMYKEEKIKYDDFYHTSPLLGFETNQQIAIYYVPLYNKKSSMSVYLLKKPILWDTKLVKTVFLLNLGLESEKLLEGLQFFLSNDKNIEYLSQETNTKKLYQYILKEYNESITK